MSDNFLTAGPPFEVKLLHTLGYDVTWTTGDIWLAGRPITAWVGVPVCCQLSVDVHGKRIRTVEFYVKELKQWELAVKGEAKKMENATVIEVIEQRLKAVREQIVSGSLLLPSFLEIAASDGKRSFCLMAQWHIESLNCGRACCVERNGNEFLLIPPVKSGKTELPSSESPLEAL